MTDKPGGTTTQIAKSAGAVSGAVMCSRVLGLVREQIFAGFFGAGFDYDTFVVAFRIPNLLRDLFGEGALSAAFVTVFTDYDTNQDKKKTWQLAGNILIFFTILVSIITLAGMYFTNDIVNLLAHGFKTVPGKTELTVLLTRIMFPFLLFVSLSAVVMGILNSKGHFFIPSLSSSFFNLGSIVGGVTLALLFRQLGKPAIVGMAWGTLFGGLLQLLIQLPSLYKTGFKLYPRLNLRDPGLKRVLLLMLPAVIGLSATQINIFVNTNFASTCAEGSVSWLNYSFRMVQLPIGLFGVAFSIAAMPVLARHAALNDQHELKQTFVSSLTMVFCLTIPATAGLILLSEPIIGLIFEHGAFTRFDTTRTAEALALYACGLFAYSTIKIMVPVFYALGDTKYPVLGSFIAVTANIIIILLTIDAFGFKSIAFATSCSMTINFLFLGAVLYHKLSGYSLTYLSKGLLKIGFSTSIMSITLFYLKNLLADLLAGNIINQLIVVIFLVGIGGIVYVLSLHLTRLPEMMIISKKIFQRLQKSR